MTFPLTYPLLETDRLVLRELTKADANEIFALRSDENHNMYVDRPLAQSADDAKAFIKKIHGLVQNNESFYWAIVAKGEQTLAGTVALWNFDPGKRTAEIGYELLPARQGKGIMQEALNRVLDFGFYELGLSSIEAWTHPDNKRSGRLLEKLGFIRDLEKEKKKPSDATEMIFTLQREYYSYT